MRRLVAFEVDRLDLDLPDRDAPSGKIHEHIQLIFVSVAAYREERRDEVSREGSEACLRVVDRYPCCQAEDLPCDRVPEAASERYALCIAGCMICDMVPAAGCMIRTLNAGRCGGLLIEYPAAEDERTRVPLCGVRRPQRIDSEMLTVSIHSYDDVLCLFASDDHEVVDEVESGLQGGAFASVHIVDQECDPSA